MTTENTPMERKITRLANKLKARGVSDSDIQFHLWSVWGTRAEAPLNRYFARCAEIYNSQPLWVRVGTVDAFGAYGPDEEYRREHAVQSVLEAISNQALLEIFPSGLDGALVETREFPTVDAGRAFGVFLDGKWAADWGWDSEPREYADWVEVTERGAGMSI